jgi:hypothetical protein
MDMSNYKMIYKDQVFNVVNVMPTLTDYEQSNTNPKITFIEASYIDECGELKIIRDEAWMFKFVRR